MLRSKAQDSLSHKQTLGCMEPICFSSNIGVFDPSPTMLAHAFQLFKINKFIFIFYYFMVIDYKVSPKLKFIAL